MNEHLPPSEPDLRRDDFQPGEPVVLSDGQTWTFPRPVMSDMFPSLLDGKLVLTPGSDLGPAYDGMVDRFLEADTFGSEHLALTALAFALLRRNYRLEHSHLKYLLRIKRADDPESESNIDMWGRIAEIALGRSTQKKTTDVG